MFNNILIFIRMDKFYIHNIATAFFILFCGLSLFSQEIKFTEEEKEWISKHQVINYGYDPNWPPYEMLEDGVMKGVVTEYINILEDKTGIDFVPYPDLTWEETLSKFKSGELKFIQSAGITEEREKYMAFTEAFISDPLVIVTRKDYDFVGGLSDLNGKVISIPQNYFSVELIKRDFPKIKITEKESIYLCLEELSTGKVDAFVGALGVISYYINQKGFTNLKIAAPTQYKNVNIAMAASKDWSVLRDIAQKVIENIPQDQRNEIRNNWISVRYEYGINTQKLVKYGVITFLIILLIVTIFIVWNRTLQKQIRLRKITENKLSESLIEIQKQNDEKTNMLKEIHHRVKNNLQVVNSLLRTQVSKVEDKNVIEMFKKAQSRVVSMALLHEKMYKSENLKNIDVQEHFTLLITDLIKTYSVNKNIQLDIDIEKIAIGMNTMVPLGLIVNEFISNSLKHAFKNTTVGTLTVKLKKIEARKYELIIGDDGVGISIEAFENSINTTGSRLTQAFVKQLKGSLEVLPGKGTTFKIIFYNID